MSTTAARTQTRFAESEEKGKDAHLEAAGAATPVERTDSQPGSSKYASSEAGLTHSKEHQKALRKVTWKLDLLIVPTAIILYLSAYLDRGNLGNARLQGLQRDVLDGDDTKFSIALMCFYLTYVVFGIPGTLLAKQFLPSTSIAAGAFVWSVAAASQAGARGPAGVYACRLFVGIGEACFGQAMGFYLSLFYSKSQLSKRVGLYLSAGALAGAFGGLIAYGVAHIPDTKIAQWRILFLIEGLPGVPLAIFVFLCLPSRPERTRYLTQEERTLVCTRLNADNQHEDYTGIEWRSVKRTFLDWKAWANGVQWMCLNMCLASVSSFLPGIVKNLGYSNADAQLYTVPPYAVCVVFMYCITTWSDRKQSRGLPIALVCTIGMVGWIILKVVDAKTGNMRLRYFACFCIASASYSAAPLIISWAATNQATESSRATALGMLNLIGQPMSIAASFIFPSKEGPQFNRGASINIAFQILGIALGLGLSAYYRWENRRRDRAEGGRPPKGTQLDVSEMFDKSPGFRYVV